MLFNTVALLAAFVLALASVVSAAAPPTKNVTIVDDDGRFCLLLPPEFGGDIADNVHRAISWCTWDIPSISGEKLLPEKFIVSRHYKLTDRYVQMTGTFDRDQLGFDKDDEGGQSDPKHPNGALCQGYPYFVQLVEPDVQLFCLRCCKYRSDCPIDMSGEGCKKVIPGNYG